ncbi:MAG: hypothetical protein JNN15_15470 [Blastocatellia bacterium]|nr:hypothetical protein [Blastocatellia bacterium]
MQESFQTIELFKRVISARQASQQERKELLFDHAEEVINALLDNSSLTEEELYILAQRKDLSNELFRRLSNDGRVLSSPKVRRALIFNPKTPASISLKFLNQLFTFDLVALLLVVGIAGEVKTAAEEMLFRKLGQLSVGEKLTLAKRTNSDRILTQLLEDSSREVVSSVLINPFLREGTVCTAIRKGTVKQHTVELIAINQKWSCRHDVRYALLRTRHITLGLAINFLQSLTQNDLRELASDPTVSIQIRTYIKNSLAKTGSLKIKR